MPESAAATESPAAGYRPRQRFAIIVAVSMLVTIMVAAAFSTGVYIGNNRELAPGTLAGAGAPARQGQPGAPQQGAQGGPNQQPQVPFDAMGAVQGVSASSLMVQVADGPRPVVYDTRTVFVRPDGSTLRVTDVRPGAIVGIRLRPGTTPPTADVVTLLPPQGAQQPAAQ